MRDLGHGLRLAQEPRRPPFVGAPGLALAEELDGHLAVERRVVAEEDDAHAADAERVEDDEAADGLAARRLAAGIADRGRRVPGVVLGVAVSSCHSRRTDFGDDNNVRAAPPSTAAALAAPSLLEAESSREEPTGRAIPAPELAEDRARVAAELEDLGVDVALDHGKPKRCPDDRMAELNCRPTPALNAFARQRNR